MPRKDMGQAARPPRCLGFPSILCRRTSIRENSTLRSVERGITGAFYGSSRRTTQPWTTSIGKASWSALAGSWLGWMFDGYESYSLVLLMSLAVRQLLPPESLPKTSLERLS